MIAQEVGKCHSPHQYCCCLLACCLHSASIPLAPWKSHRGADNSGNRCMIGGRNERRIGIIIFASGFERRSVCDSLSYRVGRTENNLSASRLVGSPPARRLGPSRLLKPRGGRFPTPPACAAYWLRARWPDRAEAAAAATRFRQKVCAQTFADAFRKDVPNRLRVAGLADICRGTA